MIQKQPIFKSGTWFTSTSHLQKYVSGRWTHEKPSGDATAHISEWLQWKEYPIGEDMEQLDPLLVNMYNGTTTL